MWENVLPIAVLALTAAVIMNKSTRANDGELIYNADLRLIADATEKPTSIITSAAVLAAAQKELSARAGCRVEFTSVKTLTSSQSDNGGAIYNLDAMVMNTCTLAQTLERMQLILEQTGRVTVVNSVAVTPVPTVAKSDTPSAAQTALDVIGVGTTVREGGKKLGVGYSFADLVPFENTVAAFPHKDVTSPELFGKAPPEIPDNLDYRIFTDMKKEPATDLINSVAYEESALSIMYR